MWLVGDRMRHKQVAKVWVHSDAKQNHVEMQISEGDMCRQLLSLLEGVKCKKVKDIGMEKFKNIQESFDFVYERHQQVPIGHQKRKRMTSQIPQKEDKKNIEDSVNITASREKVIEKNPSKLQKFF